MPRDPTVPALVLQGQFDPNLRPEQGRRVTDVIGSHARWVEFEGIGHSVRHYSPCAKDLMATFVAAPAASLTLHARPDLQIPSCRCQFDRDTGWTLFAGVWGVAAKGHLEQRTAAMSRPRKLND